MRIRFTFLSAAILAALLLTACGAPAPGVPASNAPADAATPVAGEPAGEAPAATTGPLAGTSWMLSQIGGVAPLASEPMPELIFDTEGGIAGSTGCNNFFGPVTVSGETITFGELGSTMKACPDELMQQEQNFFNLMRAVTTYTIAEQSLTLSTADGQSLVFTQAADPLAGTVWTLSQIGGAAPVADAVAELSFDSVGGVSGSTGCNRFFGPYTVSGQTITFGELGSTMMACADPLMQQEQSFFNLMRATTTYSIVDQSLTLSTADGQSLVFTKSVNPLADTNWTLTELGGAAPAASEKAAGMSFDNAGGVSGSTGCNSFFGPYTLSGQNITFGDLGSTRMACPEPLMQQEQTFFNLMRAVTSYTITDTTLTLLTTDGQSLVFTRA